MSVKIQAKAELARRANNRKIKAAGGVKTPCATPELLSASAKELRAMAGIPEKAPKVAKVRKAKGPRKAHPHKGMTRLHPSEQKLAAIIVRSRGLVTH